jgi:long-chain acyl-CoA synthetase
MAINPAPKKFSTLIQMIDHIGQNYRNPEAFNFKKNSAWINISTQEFVDQIKFFALGLKEIGLEKNDGFGILSYPNPIWLIADFASITAGGISVPIFSNIAPQNLLFQLNDADVKFIFCDNAECLEAVQNISQNNSQLAAQNISQLASQDNSQFKKIITYGFTPDEENGVDKNIIKYEDLIALGQKIHNSNPDYYQKLTADIKEDDLAAIIYTSGSTGTPKGVEITHKNLVSQIEDAGQFFPLQETDQALSFLPLAHIFERMVVSYYVSQGIAIYFADDVKNVGETMKEIRPTLMTVVPRMMEKVYKKMKSNVENGGLIKRIIGNAAFKLAKRCDPEKLSLSDKILLKIFDLLVYKKLRAALGGRLRMMICGGAALSVELEKFFRNIGVTLFVGYGTTESSPVIAANNARFHKTGTVGQPFLQVEVKLNPDGELLARGANIMRGYHKNLSKTAEVLTADGWLKTGDLAAIDQENYVKIIGRKKELFKTANGKYVSPLPIEHKLLEGADFLAAAAIIAEGKKFVSCLLFADFEIMDKYKSKFNAVNLSDEEFLSGKIIADKINNLIAKINAELNHWEQIQKYYLAKEPISVESGELTPSMKLRRSVVEEKYRDVIEEFYKE